MEWFGGAVCLLIGALMLAVPVGMVLLIVFLVRHGARVEKERRQARRILADRLGLEFDPRHDFRLLRYLGDFKVFNVGHNRQTSNVTWGRFRGSKITCFDYRYSTPGSESDVTHYLTVVALEDPELDLPRYRVWPRSALDWLRFWKDADEFRLGDDGFDERCCLAGPDRGRIGRAIDESVVRFHLANPDVQAEGDGGRLLVYRSITTAHAAEDLIERAYDLLELLRRSARAEGAR